MSYYETKEDILKLGEIDPEFDAYLKANPPQTVRYDDINIFKDNAEARWQLLFTSLGEPPASVKQTRLTYQTRDGHTNQAKLYQPSTVPADGSPLVVLFHGGGFAVGMPEAEEALARNLVKAFGATCLSAGYRLTPQWPFPYPINDAWDALQWAAANGESWGANPSVGFVVGGTSAGGNISAVLALKARDHNLSPPLTGQYLSIPTTCFPSQIPEKYAHLALSHKQNALAPVLPQAAIDMFMDAYKPDPQDFENFGVMRHPKGHKDLPKAFLQIDGLDPLRDEGLIYEKVLREEGGVATKFIVYPGLPHGHWSFYPMLKSSVQFRQDQITGFAWLFDRAPQVQVVDAGVSSA